MIAKLKNDNSSAYTPIWWERCAKLFFPERPEFA